MQYMQRLLEVLMLFSPTSSAMDMHNPTLGCYKHVVDRSLQ